MLSSFVEASIARHTVPIMSFWDDRYAEGEYAYGTEPNDFLKETLAELKLPKGRCLLLADGEGRNGVFMAELGFEVVSVDFSSAGMEKAKLLAKDRKVKIETVVADLGEYDLGIKQWDCIVGIYCHLPPPVRAKVLAAIPRSLKKDGHFLLECYTPDQIKNKTGGPPSPEPMYSKTILADALGSHLEVIRNEETEREVMEGKYHTGKAAVVRFIGKKSN